MKKWSTFIALAVCLAQATFSQINPSPTATAPADLQGEWVVDLRPSPGSEPYLKEMTIVFEGDKSFVGSFYDTPFDNGETNTAWGKTFFAFSTQDGNATYFTSGFVENGALKGLTYCDKRGFVMPWVGERKEEIKK